MSLCPSELLAISVKHLNFSYESFPVLDDISLSLPGGSRCLLVGHNGSGKSTLLRILAGKKLVQGDISVFGKNTFRDQTGVTYLGIEWANSPYVRQDIPVSRLLKTLGAERNQERCKVLLDIMEVDPNWHMHQVSDGQRRRVQIVLGLLEPWSVLLLDEVTVDLDVIVRANLLKFLKTETESRGACILYATHIFDGLGGWPTDIAHLDNGVMKSCTKLSDSPELDEFKRKRMAPGAHETVVDNSPLLLMVEQWLRQDYQGHDEVSKKRRKGGEHEVTRWEMLEAKMREYSDTHVAYWR